MASHPPIWGLLSLKSRKGTKPITGAILSRIVLISLCKVSHPSFKTPGSATVKYIQTSAKGHLPHADFRVTEVDTQIWGPEGGGGGTCPTFGYRAAAKGLKP